MIFVSPSSSVKLSVSRTGGQRYEDLEKEREVAMQETCDFKAWGRKKRLAIGGAAEMEGGKTAMDRKGVRGGKTRSLPLSRQ